MSMVENLKQLKTKGINEFLKSQAEKIYLPKLWRYRLCPRHKMLHLWIQSKLKVELKL